MFELSETKMHPLVLAKSAMLKLNQTKVIFPGERSEPPLTSIDYEQFLFAVHHKFSNAGIQTTLQELVLSCDDHAALEGLTSFVEKMAGSDPQFKLPFQRVTLDLTKCNLTDSSTREPFLAKLNAMLVVLSQQNLAALTFLDPHQQLASISQGNRSSTPPVIPSIAKDLQNETAEQVTGDPSSQAPRDEGRAATSQELVTFIISNDNIAIDITLPDYLVASELQKELDVVLAKRLRERRIAQFNPDVELVVDLTTATQVAPRQIRKRPRLTGKQNLAIDIELQQEQQQELQVAVQLEQGAGIATGLQDLAGTDGDDGPVYDLVTFGRAIRGRAFSDQAKSYLVGDRRAQDTLWLTWVGAFSESETFYNESIRISKAACEELLAHVEQFQLGLDLKNLPAGFRIKTVSRVGQQTIRYVHFDANLKLLSPYQPLQVQLTTASELVPVSLLQWQQLLTPRSGDPVSPGLSRIQLAFELLKQAPYERESYRRFMQFLPQMLLLDEGQLNYLFASCTTDHPPRLNTVRLKFLLENIVSMKSRLEDADNQNILSKLKEVFPESTQKSHALEFISNYTEKAQSLQEHLLWQLTADETSTRAKIQKFHRDLPGLDLNALLQVYLHVGEKGIDAVIRLYQCDPVIFNELYLKLWAKERSYLPLLSPGYLEAMEKIKGFKSNPAEANWWDTLLAQQSDAQSSQVNLIDLVNAFSRFKEELAALSTHDGQPLTLPPVCHLTGAKSFPVALSRLLTLMQHVHEQNRHAQWAMADELDLSSNGFIKAITAPGSKKWAFITPQMQLNAAHEAERSETTTITRGIHAYSAPANWNLIVTTAQDSQEKVVEDFFRFVSFQQQQAQLPLDFYNHFIDLIQQTSLNWGVRRCIICLMASATTSANKVITMPSLIEANKESRELINFIVEMPFLPGVITKAQKKQARMNLLMSIAQLGEIPPLPVFNQLLKMIAATLDTLPKLMTNPKKLSAAYQRLARYVKEFGFDVYTGLMNYLDEDYRREPDLFFNYLSVIEKIKKVYWSNSPETIANALLEIDVKTILPLISRFQLTVEEIDSICAYFPSGASTTDVGHRNRARELSELLRHMSVKGHAELRRLNADDLRFILQEVQQHSEQTVISLVRSLVLTENQRLADYFPVDYLEQYGRQGISDELITKIRSSFKAQQQQQQVEKLLLKFFAAADPVCYEAKIVNKLLLICKNLSVIDQSLFLTKLLGASGLYTPAQRLDDSTNAFVQLLDTVIQAGSPNEFLNFIASERQLLGRLEAISPMELEHYFEKGVHGQWVHPHLAQKAVFYLQTALPNVQQIKNLRFSSMDVMPSLIETILKTPAADLTRAFEAEERTQLMILNRDKNKIYRAESALIVGQNAFLQQIVVKIQDGKTVDFAAAIKQTDLFTQAGVLEEPEGCERYLQMLKRREAVKKVSLEDARELTQSSSTLFRIFIYRKQPDLIPLEEKQRYETIIGWIERDYPEIGVHEDFFAALYMNPNFWDALGEKDVLAAMRAEDLLDHDDKIKKVLAALATDLTSVAEFVNQTDQLQQNLGQQNQQLYTYSNVLQTIYKKINRIVTENPNSQQHFFELLQRYLQAYQPASDQLLPTLFHFVATCEQYFSEVRDQNVVLALCLQFKGDKSGALTPADLDEFFNHLGRLEGLKQLDLALDIPVVQSVLIKIAVELINNQKGYTTNAFGDLCRTIIDDSALPGTTLRFLTALEKIYARAPIPSMEKVLSWHREASLAVGARVVDAAAYAKKMDGFYAEFGREPAHREPQNGLHPRKAAQQLKLFEGLGADAINPDLFKIKIEDAQRKTPDELIAQLAQFKNKLMTEHDYYTLVAVAAELLYRSKGCDDYHADGSLVMGSSMEINTTQYLAILAMLKTPDHVTSEIGTGEGKSRIMMIALACQYALGHTVDFVTADAQLATRDFLEYKTFFTMIGAPTSMIFAHSAPNEYQRQGINFSDPANLSLFRNKARSEGLEAQVLDERPEKRDLLLDEADRTYFDVSDTRFNFSKEGDESLRDMQWVYPLLMEYFAQLEITLLPGETEESFQTNVAPLNLYYDDVELSCKKFIQFASVKSIPELDLRRLKLLSNAQIEQWQASAVVAMGLKFQQDFVIEPDVLINTPLGPRISSEAQLLVDNRVAKSSKFSFGVHQCLHARLNMARRNLAQVSEESLRETLAACEQEFFIPDEKQIIYSSTSKNLLDDYNIGTLKAVTGTAGSIIEREEAALLYGQPAGTASVEPMKFITVPRDKGLNRRDKAIRLTSHSTEDKAEIRRLQQQLQSDENIGQPALRQLLIKRLQELESRSQLAVVIEEIKQARAKNQPILLIAEHEQESEFLYQKLQTIFPEHIQHIGSQLSVNEVETKIKAAGIPQQITVSTGMIGRGTDIALQGNAKLYGLNVMMTYLPRERDQLQIVGRSGRFGAAGETLLILDKARTETTFGHQLDSKFYANVEAFVQKAQAKMDRNKQCERLIKHTVGDFRKQLTDNFYTTILFDGEKKHRPDFIPLWTAFFDSSDKKWAICWSEIQKQLASDVVDLDKLNALFASYRQDVQKDWDVLRRGVDELARGGYQNKQAASNLLVVEIPPLRFSSSTLKMLQATHQERQKKPAAVKIYDHYSRGHDGRAVQYTSWTIPVVASLKGYANLLPFVHFDNARPPFANLRAKLAGTGMLFPNFRASTNKGKIIGGLGFGLAGAAVGGLLIATGIFSPIGLAVLGFSALVTSMAIFTGIGLVVGSLFGIAAGAVRDKMVAQRHLKAAIDRQPIAQGLSPNVHNPLADLGGPQPSDSQESEEAPYADRDGVNPRLGSVAVDDDEKKPSSSPGLNK